MDCLELHTGAPTSLDAMRNLGRPVVVEFWTTRCERCPVALADMEKRAAGIPESSTTAAMVVACALATSDDASAELRKAQTLVCDDEAFPHLRHLFMTWPQKEEAKRRFGFQTVPHCVVFDRAGTVAASGAPRNVREALASVEIS